MVEAGVAEDPVRFPVSVVASGIVHRQEGQKLAEGRLLVVAVDILHDDALPQYLVPEG